MGSAFKRSTAKDSSATPLMDSGTPKHEEANFGFWTGAAFTVSHGAMVQQNIAVLFSTRLCHSLVTLRRHRLRSLTRINPYALLVAG